MIRVRLTHDNFGRRTAACLVLVAYCVTSVGIPISSRSIKKGDVRKVLKDREREGKSVKGATQKPDDSPLTNRSNGDTGLQGWE